MKIIYPSSQSPLSPPNKGDERNKRITWAATSAILGQAGFLTTLFLTGSVVPTVFFTSAGWALSRAIDSKAVSGFFRSFFGK